MQGSKGFFYLYFLCGFGTNNVLFSSLDADYVENQIFFVRIGGKVSRSFLLK